MNFSDTTVIIPTLNEEKNIPKLIGYLDGLYPNIWIIVSDDGSKDKTKFEVKKISKRNRHVKFYDRTNRKVHGLTISIIDAARYVKTRYIVVMDADFQHPPEKVREVVEALRNSSDVVIASREGKIEGWPFYRKVLSKTAILLGRIRLTNRNFKYMDFGGGFFGIRTKFFQNIIKRKEKKFEPKGYKVMFDMLKYAPKNAKVSEIPYQFGLRKAGESKLNKKHVYYYFRSLLK